MPKSTIGEEMTRISHFVAVLLSLLAACASSTSSTPTTTAVITTTAEATTTSTEPVTTTEAVTTTTAMALQLIEIKDGAKVVGLDTLSVRVGEAVDFVVLADVSDEVHVHGYDLTFDVTAGETTRVQFIADATGIFEVELEAAALHIVDIEVTP